MYVHYNNMPLSSSYKERCSRRICSKNQNTHFVSCTLLFPTVLPFMR